MREDTRPETPLAKSTSDPPPDPEGWRSPRPANDEPSATGAASGAHFAWATGSGKVRTFQASGPAGFALVLLVILAVGALIAVFFVFAVGIGTALALGAGAAALLGFGANRIRRRLAGGRRHRIGAGER